ncbi:hypothetical protein C1N61_28000 (plasmid) [Priestia aryabhattai]
MSHETNKKCTVCNERFVFKDLEKILGEDLQICINCLEEKMRKGEIQSFGEKQYETIVRMLEEMPEENTGSEERSLMKVQEQNLDAELFVLQFGRDLTSLARQGKLTPVIGRKKEIEETILILSRKFKTNPLLLGEPGVGKTAIIEGVSQRIADGTVPEGLQNKRLIELNIGNLVAGTKFRGEFEARLKKIIEEVEQHKNVILFLDEFHTIAGAGGAEGSVDAANILKPSLARGNIQVIGATTFDEYRMYIQKDGALSRRMINVQVEEPTTEEAVEIISGLLPIFEQHHGVKFESNVVKKAVDLSKRYLTERYLPDKAIDLIDETAANRKISQSTPSYDYKKLEAEKINATELKNNLILDEKYEEAKQQLIKEKDLEAQIKKIKEKAESEKKKNSVVTIGHVTSILEKKTGIPVKDTDKEDREKLKLMDESLRKFVKGQERAIELTTLAIRRSKLKLKDPNRPIGAFLFLGPTGVGKTELAKALAHEMFGDKKAMIRIDMSEFAEKHSVSKLIGSPPGYVGHEEGGKLTNLLRRKPFSIVLLDEVEKAHPDVFNVMLQIFEDGIITDNKGKTVDAKNAVFILTSNLGSKLYSTNQTNNLGFSSKSEEAQTKDLEKKVIEFVRKDGFFRPEFLNRLDATVVFNPLTDKAMKEIVEKQASELADRIDKEGYKLVFSDEALELLKKEGYRPEFGAREAKRKVEAVTDLLANRILDVEKEEYMVTVENEQLIVK